MTEKIDPSRFRRRDYQAEAVRPRPQPLPKPQPQSQPQTMASRPVIAEPKPSPRPEPVVTQEAPQPAQPPKPAHKPKRRKKSKKRLVRVLLILFVLLGLAGGAFAYFEQKTSSTVPKSIVQSVSFPVYKPDIKQLPAGYSYNSKSFATPVNGAYTLTVKYDGAKSLVISAQPAPTSAALQKFLDTYLPTRTEHKVTSGTALIGISGGKTRASLSTNDTAWMVVTAPGDINTNELLQVLNSIKEV